MALLGKEQTATLLRIIQAALHHCRWHVTLFHQAGPYNEVPLINYFALSWTLYKLQVTLATLTSLLQEAQLSGKPTTCSDILHAVDAPALITLLCSATISNTEAAYGSRTAALHLLTQLNACIRLTWDSTPGAMPGSEWDSAVVGAIGGIVRHVCMPNHDTRLGGFKGKQLLRQALACLKEVVGAVPVELWSEAWQQVCCCVYVTADL